MVPAPQAVVKGDGSLMWGEVALHHATVADLLRAREQGFFKGDPLALVFDRRPFGNGTLFSWDQLADVLSNFGLVAGAYLALRNVIQIAVDDVKRLWLLSSQLRRPGSETPRS